MLIIKVGGGKAINWDYIAQDLVLVLKKRKIVIVHGASRIRDEIANRLGRPTKIIVSPSGVESVFTDKVALDILLMSYAGLVNKRIVEKLQALGINAVGLSGVDGRIWEGTRKKTLYAKIDNKIKTIKDTFTGRVEKINTRLIRLLLNNNFVPIICAPAISSENEIINIDNDWATAIMANALGIKEIVILFEAPGMLKNPKDEKTLIKKIGKDEIDKFIKYAQGRMKKKLLGAKKAFEGDVAKIYFGDGRFKNPVKSALSGGGTIIS